MTSALVGNKPLLTKIDLSVRTYDIDFNGHVSNIVYVRWLEDMRNIAFEKIMGLKACVELGYMPVLVSTNISYKQSINLFDKPCGYLWVKSHGRISFEFEEEIIVEGKVCASAVQVVVFLDSLTGRPIRLPQIIQEKFAQLEVKKDY